MMRLLSVAWVWAVLSRVSLCEETYRAAVIEHQCTYAKKTWTKTKAQEIMNENLDSLEISVVSAKTQGAEIVLLPEFALTALVWSREEMEYYLESIPDANMGDDSTPCNNAMFSDRPILERVSCLAKDTEIYLGMNWGDWIACDVSTDPNCPEDNHYQYNTQIVFDPSGQVIAKYWKIHGFNEDEYDDILVEDPTTFDFYASNGDKVTFGLMTCFDSMFATPLLNFLNDYNYEVVNFMLSHWWVNQYSSMSATQWFESISRTYGVNFLIASSWWEYWPANAQWSSGSGIYSAGDILASWYNADNEQMDKLLIADVPYVLTPNIENIPELTEYLTIAEPPEGMCDEWTYWVNAPGAHFEGSVSCGEFVCSVDATVAADSTDGGFWFLEIYQGYYDEHDGVGVYYYEEYCTINQCVSSIGRCSKSEQNDEGSTTFDSLTLEATWTGTDGTLFMMSSGGDGDVYKEIESTFELTNNIKIDKTSKAVATNIDTPIINLSFLTRFYAKDAVLLPAETSFMSIFGVNMNIDDVLLLSGVFLILMVIAIVYKRLYSNEKSKGINHQMCSINANPSEIQPLKESQSYGTLA